MSSEARASLETRGRGSCESEGETKYIFCRWLAALGAKDSVEKQVHGAGERLTLESQATVKNAK